jgi:AcrR family transcriptional regulator
MSTQGQPTTKASLSGRPERAGRAAVPRDRKRVIMDAALQVFNDRGVAVASIDDIKRVSGASVGSIYHHFEGGKHEIAERLYLEALRDYQEGFVSALEEAASTRDGVIAGVRHHLRWITENADRARFLMFGGVAPGEDLSELNRRFLQGVGRWMQPAVECGELLELTPDVLTALWVGPAQELARFWLAGRTRGSLEDAADVLAQAAWRSLSQEGS